MVKPAMVGWMVHGNAANDVLKLFHVKHFFAAKNLHISNKSRTFAAVFMNKLRSDALRSDCVGCFVVLLA